MRRSDNHICDSCGLDLSNGPLVHDHDNECVEALRRELSVYKRALKIVTHESTYYQPSDEEWLLRQAGRAIEDPVAYAASTEHIRKLQADLDKAHRIADVLPCCGGRIEKTKNGQINHHYPSSQACANRAGKVFPSDSR